MKLVPIFLTALICLQVMSYLPPHKLPISLGGRAYAKRHPHPQQISFITESHPWNAIGPDGAAVPAPIVRPLGQKTHNHGVYIYSSNSYPLSINNPFQMYSLPRVFDLYAGLGAPYNMEHPTNYRFGINPYSSPGYGPNLGFGDPFQTGIYNGQNFRNWGLSHMGMMNPALHTTNGVFQRHGFGADYANEASVMSFNENQGMRTNEVGEEVLQTSPFQQQNAMNQENVGMSGFNKGNEMI